MRRRIFPWLVVVLVPCGLAAQETRQLGAHMHGESVLNIAIEGHAVAMELEAPALDIVGFEHAPSSDADRAAIEAATMTLSEPLDVFVFPAAAMCTVSDAAVRHVFAKGAKDDHGGGAAPGPGIDRDAEQGDDPGDPAAHSEFRAVYELSCANPGAIDAIDFAFFNEFPTAQSVEVQIISEHGQAAFEVERGQPRVALDEVLG